MNTSEVAKLLGVSNSTIKRWVKELGLSMERNERGHYLFNQEDIEYLRFIQEQIQNGILLHEVTMPDTKPRKGVVKLGESDKTNDDLLPKIKELERKIDSKADSVASYQLLQHRSEIEDLQKQIKKLTNRIEVLELELNKSKKSVSPDLPLVFDQPKSKRDKKRKNIISSLFGF